MTNSNVTGQQVLIVDGNTANAMKVQKVLLLAGIPCQVVSEFALETRKDFDFCDIQLEDSILKNDDSWYRKFAGKKGKSPRY